LILPPDPAATTKENSCFGPSPLVLQLLWLRILLQSLQALSQSLGLVSIIIIISSSRAADVAH